MGYGELAGGSPSDVDGVQAPSPIGGGWGEAPHFHLPAYGIHVPLSQVMTGRGVEPAVDTAACTEWNMDVKTSQRYLLLDDLLFTIYVQNY